MERVEPSTTHLDKEIHSLCHPSKLVWLRKRFRQQFMFAHKCLRMPVRQKPDLSSKVFFFCFSHVVHEFERTISELVPILIKLFLLTDATVK
jgi:hypothetical protein